jgi:predicted NAD/FAD-binding protein
MRPNKLTSASTRTHINRNHTTLHETASLLPQAHARALTWNFPRVVRGGSLWIVVNVRQTRLNSQMLLFKAE